MGRTACTEPQCLYNGALYLYLIYVCIHTHTYIYTNIYIYIYIYIYINDQFQWPRGLKRGYSTARLVGLRVQIPRRGRGCMSVVSVVCCQVEVSATIRSLVQRSPTDCGVSLCVI